MGLVNSCSERIQENDLSLNQNQSLDHSLSDINILAKAKNHPHLLEQLLNLSESKKKEKKGEILNYLNQLRQIDFELIDELYKDLYANKQKNEDNIQFLDIDRIPDQQVFKAFDNPKINEYEQEGLKTIAEGKVGVIIMAGGQASRLGSDKPKGMFQLGNENQKEFQNATLFQIFANKIEALERWVQIQKKDFCKGKDLIHLFIMTSSSTDKDTRDFFKMNKYFGLSEGQVHFFMQNNLPAVDLNGKIILKDEFEIFMAPNGNGGLYEGIQTILGQIYDYGIEYLHVCGVDNLLNKLADPLMVGYAVKENKEFVSKFVEKVDPEEKVGVHIQSNGVLSMIEYSELSDEQKKAKQSNGKLKFNQSFLAQFLIKVSTVKSLLETRDFSQAKKDRDVIEQRRIEKVPEEKIKEEIGEARFEKASAYLGQKGWAKHHLAMKKITPLWNSEQKKSEPYTKDTNNGMKFEQFIFDPFSEIKNYGLIEVQRSSEFAPIKNKDSVGSDSRKTALELQSKLHRKWLEKAGYIFAPTLKVDGDTQLVYVDARLSHNGEQIQTQKGHNITKLPFVLTCQEKPKNEGKIQIKF
ncbi:hypothetical protein PPERSA_07453 [Pseudocohnilembus persalinus]|uniref:UDP-N-acetylglucosamine diphosphorylase n=1 Tax=Pseudocohnilembus persalinus TaxID=266149 RepID=A0A0V0QAN6_PSEPJ|nr:hypothetical protein PPERSA_07453 [Pseudocohnilembus persalinus]|eukprot:KRW99210.1 hypothetical protein PPERSA_07453 [Pseudocohnilembus persalinus]